jgi:hypothetical protein
MSVSLFGCHITLISSPRTVSTAGLAKGCGRRSHEAIREGYEDAVGTLVSIDARDGMNALAELRSQTPIDRSQTIAIIGGTLIDGKGGAPLRDANAFKRRLRRVDG